jgi:hypothetical protein
MSDTFGSTTIINFHPDISADFIAYDSKVNESCMSDFAINCIADFSLVTACHVTGASLEQIKVLQSDKQWLFILQISYTDVRQDRLSLAGILNNPSSAEWSWSEFLLE